jgi:hypothetical protein
MSIHSLGEYQKSKVVVAELEKIIKVLNTTELGLKKYRHYRPVQSILTTIYNEKALLLIYLEQYKIILETKGRRGL